MVRHSVTSSRISSVGWENDVLEIGFPNNSVYQYYNVSKSEYDAFINSSSLGSSLDDLDKKHPYKKL